MRDAPHSRQMPSRGFSRAIKIDLYYSASATTSNQ